MLLFRREVVLQTQRQHALAQRPFAIALIFRRHLLDRRVLDRARQPIQLDPAPEGMQIEQLDGNRLIASVTDKDFRLTVIGFDKQRDLFVKVGLEESDAETL